MVHLAIDQIILIGHDIEAVVPVGSHHTLAVLLQQGVHVAVDVITVGGGCIKISEGGWGLSGEAIHEHSQYYKDLRHYVRIAYK